MLQGFLNDVIGIQADVRFINMAAQRFLDESKKYQKDLQEYHNKVQKSPKNKRGPEGPEFNQTRDKVKSANERYQLLKGDSETMMHQLQLAREKQHEYHTAVNKLEKWLQDAENRADHMKSQPVPSSPEKIQEKITEVKAFNAEVFAKAKQVEEMRTLAKNLVDSLKDLGADDETLVDITTMVSQVAHRHAALTDNITDWSNVLQTSLVQSQGIQEGLDGLLTWLKETETTLNSMRPISCSQESLNDQIQELQVLRADIESHVPSVNSVNRDAADAIETSGPQAVKAIEAKLDALNTRFDQAAMRCNQRGDDLQDVADKLATFHEDIENFNGWLIPTLEVLESKETSQLDNSQFRDKLNTVKGETKHKLADLEKIKEIGQNLVDNPKTSETGNVKDSMADCERNWHDFNEVVTDKEKEAMHREEQSNRYEELKNLVQKWLIDTETKMDALEPVAIDVEIIAKQIEELQVNTHIFSHDLRSL